MNKALVLCATALVLGAVIVDPPPTIIEIDGEQVYVITVEKSEIMCEFCTAPVDKHEFCIEQFGWISQGAGEPLYWVSMGKVCMTKQWASGWHFNEVPTLNISGFHEVNIEAGWVNIDSEFGTIIDGEEAKTIFIPAVCK